ncbi:hypothetical protein [Tuwongella immobilis]|uniref:Uncharacterized protein n=1 Tax=Tuwongella immobilis TaxID=692036 RepID=A0A6C2YJI1_9BACT|nr:hypothetical protein [Tuwongella immobilis]VIP01273.1 unnamed protein product [Tuwongella immobilis]VTR97972.1 unnamed protein product [Tuwongella immobilis]
MIPLFSELEFRFRFAEERIVPRFHLEGIAPGVRIAIFALTASDAAGESRGDWLMDALVGDASWVTVEPPLRVGPGRGFVAVPRE